MRIFLTGATGFIGSAIVPELINAGHQVLGLARSEAGAAALAAAGAEVHRGDLDDPAGLRKGAEMADGVIHTAFDHDFANFALNCEKDRRVIEALAAGLEGSDRPLIITSATGMGSVAPGQPAIEDHVDPHHPNPRVASELAGIAASQRGVNVSVVRLSQIHNRLKQGLVTSLIALAREKQVAAYVGDGQNRWSATHISDTARLYRLALERQEASARYHAVAEEGIPFREIAEVIARGLNVPMISLSPDQVADHFGWLGIFAGRDMSATSVKTQVRLGWHPTGPGLIDDLEHMRYSAPDMPRTTQDAMKTG